jgi:hypothetical protein
MQGMTVSASKVSGAVVLLVLSACKSEAPPRVYPTAWVGAPHLSGKPILVSPPGQVCLVSAQSCLSMNAPDAAPCLASSGRCATTGTLQFVEATLRR